MVSSGVTHLSCKAQAKRGAFPDHCPLLGKSPSLTLSDITLHSVGANIWVCTWVCFSSPEGLVLTTQVCLKALSKYEVLSVTVANFWWQHSKRKFKILSKKSQKPPQSKKQSQQFFDFCDGSAPKCACGVYIFFTNKISFFFSVVEVSLSAPDKFRYCNKDVKPDSGNLWLQSLHLSLDNPVTWSYSWVRVHFPLAVFAGFAKKKTVSFVHRDEEQVYL